MSEKDYQLKPTIAIVLIAICVYAVLVGIAISVSPLCAAQSGAIPETGILENNITVEVEETTIHYQKQSFWTESEFSAILENKEDFKSEIIQDFNEKLSRYGERGEYAVGADVEFEETKKATVFKCDVHDAVTKSDDSYRATFIWLLSPLGLDFIDDNFEESKEGLSWEGEVDGIPTSITIELPPQETVYAAWEEPVGHCHGHVWWAMPLPSPSPEVTPVATPTPPGFEAIFAIAGILAVAYLVLRKRSTRKDE
ncbi:MAG: PGF-CTERM sorting domain-containing protein [Methanophagales archaeon]|nr:PGF-CTERM sorting domain-containing protein [Methanophagales archaeon]